MFDIGLQEMLVIGVIALLVFGPSRLPELGRMFGRAMREFRRASDEFRSTVETNLQINEPEPIIQPPAPTFDPVPAEASAPAAEATAPLAEGTTATEETSGEPFCARRGSRIFHRRPCEWVTRIPEVDRAYFKTVAEAREQGFVACPVCEP